MRHAEAHHFRKAARDKRRPRIFAHLPSGNDTASDRQHVFNRAAQLRAGHVVGQVQAESGRCHRLNKDFAECLIGDGECQRRW